MTPKPVGIYAYWYRLENIEYFINDLKGHQEHRERIREKRKEFMRIYFSLDPSTPDYVLKDILLENGLTEYCELLFPEVKHECSKA